MRIFSNIVLGIGLFLMTFLASSVVEYFFPGSTSWIMEEIDWWYTKTIGWVIFITLVGLAIAVVWFLAIKLGPPLFEVCRRHSDDIKFILGKTLHNPAMKKAVIVFCCIIAALVAIAVIGLGIWVLSLIL